VGAGGARKAEILTAAAELFARNGYHNTTMQQIAVEVGMLKGSIYHYFRSKQEILYAVTREPLADLVEGLDRIAAEDRDGAAKVELAIRRHVAALVRAYPHLMVTTAESDEALPDGIRESIVEFRRQYQRTWEQILTEGREDGSLGFAGPPVVLVNFILGSISWMHRWYRKCDAPGEEDLAATLSGMVLRGIAAPDRQG
jgi:TetR/AcrR family transcriptional regulator, cholesterol catabolism regulator